MGLTREVTAIAELLPKGLTPQERAQLLAKMAEQRNWNEECLNKTQSGTIECTACNDSGYIYNPATNTAIVCKCIAVKRQRRLLARSGISEAFRTKTVDNYEIERNPICKKISNVAKKYLNDADEYNLKSVGFFGQSGVGKTHLSIAIANALLDRGIPVRYMPYVEKITELKNLNRIQGSRYTDDDDACYDRAVRELKTVKVLLIDDMYKGAEDKYGYINPVDKRIMFEIISERDFNKLPVIISSELTLSKLIEIDEATGGRIYKMCEEYYYIAEKDQKLNYRLRELT